MGLFGGSEPAEAEPWQPQATELAHAFGGARGLYDQGAQSYYPGQTIAGTNQNIRNYTSGAGGHAQGGIGIGGEISGYGRQMAGGLPQSQQFYSGAMDNYFNPYASAKYGNIISDSVNNNPVLQSQIEMGQQDINRNMQENIMPSIASGAVSTGNTGSSRRGVAEGIAMRGAMEQGSDLATNLQSNAYNQGINQANQWAGGEQFGQQYGMNAANQMAGMGQYGLNQMGSGQGIGAQSYQNMLGAGMYERGLEQEQLQDEQERWDFNQDAPWQNLRNYYNIIGSGNWGGRQSGGGQSSGSQLAQMGTQLGAAALMS